jgi:hypothetical protein
MPLKPGRGLGVRNKFSARMLHDAFAHWEKHGQAAMDDMREEKPSEYVRAMFSILPRELVVESVTTGLTPEERLEMIDKLKQHLLTRPQEQQPILIEAKVNGSESARARED